LIHLARLLPHQSYLCATSSIKKKNNIYRGRVKKVKIVCDRYGEAKFTIFIENSKRPNRRSRKNEYSIHGFLTEKIKGSDIWIFELEEGNHNHEPTQASAHPIIRKMHKDDQFRSRIEIQKTAGMLTKHAFDLQQQEAPGNPLIMRDYYNEREDIRRRELQERSPIHALLDILTAENGENQWWTRFRTQFETDEGPLTHLFIAYRKHIEFLMRNHEVLVLDSTYKTNRFQLPVVNIIGLTPINRLFFAGSAFIKSEKIDDYVYVFNSIKNLYDVKKLPYPRTFITDGDEEIEKAMMIVFPTSGHMLCIFHVNANIQTRFRPKIRARWDQSDGPVTQFIDNNWKEFKADWMTAIDAGTPEIWKENWRNLCEKYHREYPITITYIRDNVIAKKKKKIVACWRNKHLNWGFKASSAAESMHNALKYELGNSRGDLKHVVDNMSNLLERHYREISAEIDRQSMQYIRRFSGELLSGVVKKISMHALNKVLNQITLLTPAKGQDLVELSLCTGLFRTTIRLPCAHEIKRCKEAGEPLSIDEFHPH
jgi:hypothetical protein